MTDSNSMKPNLVYMCYTHSGSCVLYSIFTG